MADLLCRFFDVHLIDLPGFGQSPLPPTDWTTSDYADRIAKYIEEQQLQNAVIIGHSFGGRVAVQLSSSRKELVSSLVLIGAHGLRNVSFNKRTVRALVLKYAAKSLKLLDRTIGTRTFQGWFVPRFASTDYRNAGRLKNILVKAVNEDLSEQASKISAGTLLLWGELDEDAPVALGVKYHKLIEHSRIVIMPNKGHFPFQNGGEHLCARYILDFLGLEK